MAQKNASKGGSQQFCRPTWSGTRASWVLTRSGPFPRELKEINPRYSYSDHFGRVPFRKPADADQLTEGLRKAGLVE